MIILIHYQFGLWKVIDKLLVVNIVLQLGKFIQVGDPTFANALRIKKKNSFEKKVSGTKAESEQEKQETDKEKDILEWYFQRTSVMRVARGTLQSSNQRRGVMPLVLFWNFLGHMS